ncbi:MAG: hypothetical protein AB1414_17880, partial [bacterium]
FLLSGGNSRQVGSRKGIKDVHGIPLLGTMSPLSYFPTLLLSYKLNSYILPVAVSIVILIITGYVLLKIRPKTEDRR